MVHIIVDKHMNKINKYRTIAKGYRIAAQRFWLLPIPEFKISRIKNNSIHLIKNYIKKETTILREGWKRASRKDPKGEGGGQAQQNNPGKDFKKYIWDKIT